MLRVVVDLVKSTRKNAILIDWLTVSSKILNYDVCLYLLGMEKIQWRRFEGSKLRYEFRMVFQHITIHCTESWSDKYNKGCCIEISGKGCREFETFGKADWSALISSLYRYDKDVHFTRLDLAYDDFQGLLDIEQISIQARSLSFTSKLSKCEVVQTCDKLDPDFWGITVFHGARSSNVMHRIYDKRIERGRRDIPHWIRWEIQLRAIAAENAVHKAFIGSETLQLGDFFGGVVRQYVAYRDQQQNDTNKNRWPLSSWYTDFIGAVSAVSVWSARTVEYNKGRMDQYAYKQNHNHTLCELFNDGIVEYLRQLLMEPDQLPDKYKRVLQDVYEQKQKQAASAAAAAVLASAGAPSPAVLQESLRAGSVAAAAVAAPLVDKPDFDSLIDMVYSELQAYRQKREQEA